MDERIIYPNDDGGIAIIFPVACGLSVEEIARKDVPAGRPYLIIQHSDLPEDSIYRDAWTADFSNPHGHGIGAEAWHAERNNAAN
jgi:hypothetical protein